MDEILGKDSYSIFRKNSMNKFDKQICEGIWETISYTKYNGDSVKVIHRHTLHSGKAIEIRIKYKVLILHNIYNIKIT